MYKAIGWTGVLIVITGCSQPKPAKPVAQGAPVQQMATQNPPHKPVPVTPASVKFSNFATGMPDDGMWKCDPIFADVNKDGFVDIAAIPRLGDGPHVFLGNGRGEWKDTSAGLSPAKGHQSCGGGMAFGDLNGDGNIDLAVADHCNGIYIYLGDGEGHWSLAARDMFPEELVPGESRRIQFMGAESIALGDFNGDGHLDIVAGSSDEGGINIYFNDGTGKSWRRMPSKLPWNGWANRVAAVDINRDGRVDVIASYSEGPRVWLNMGDEKWQESSKGLPEPTVKGLYTGLAIGDVDEDGKLDIVVANWVDGPEAYLQQADGSWKKTPDVFAEMSGGAVGLALADVDHDGHLDIIVSGRLEAEAGFVRGVFALRGDGKGQWRFLPDSGLPSTGLAATSGVGSADLDGDGVPDVVACSGLIVETAPGPTKAILPEHILVWRSHPTAIAAAPAHTHTANVGGNAAPNDR